MYALTVKYHPASCNKNTDSLSRLVDSKMGAIDVQDIRLTGTDHVQPVMQLFSAHSSDSLSQACPGISQLDSSLL